MKKFSSKRFVALCMAGVMLMGTPVFADNLIYNNSVMTYTDQQPVIVNSRTYVPIRDVFEKLGFTVEWDADTKIVTLSNDYYNISLTTVTSKIFVVDTNMNITAKKLENAVQVVNGRTMLPLREILEAVGYELDYDAATKSTTIKDANDYTALQAAKAKVDSLSDYEAYKVDTSKEQGTLTDEEKEYIAKLAEVLDGDNYEEKYEKKYGNLDNLEDLDADTVYAVLNELSAEIKGNISALDTPDSLKGVSDATIGYIDGYIGKLSNMVTTLQLLDGETDDVKSALTFAVALLSMAAIQVESTAVDKAMDDFCAERNIDRDSTFEDVTGASMFNS